MTALEERLRTELHGFGLRYIADPRDPDPYVFGVMYERGEHHGGWPFPACQVHQVGWRDGDECWCCAAGVPPC